MELLLGALVIAVSLLLARQGRKKPQLQPVRVLARSPRR
ncbi:hypothetical protein DERA104750_06190 [Deinococcus radiodurans]|jgi:hypothetical protein